MLRAVKKGKGFPYSLPSVGLGADPWRVQAVSPRSAGDYRLSHPSGGRLSLHSAMPVVTFPAAERHRPLAGTKLYCLVTEAHRCEQLAQGCYAALLRVGIEPTTYRLQVQRSTRFATSSSTWISAERSEGQGAFCRRVGRRRLWKCMTPDVLCNAMGTVVQKTPPSYSYD